MGISRDSRHKRRLTGGRRKIHIKKRKFELGRPPAMTKLGAARVHPVRCRGGNMKFRAMRLESGTFSWGSEVFSAKTRILDVKYNSSNNELVRTKTLVKGCIVEIDAAPFKTWYQQKYGHLFGHKKVKDGKKIRSFSGASDQEIKRSNHVQRKIAKRKADVEDVLDDAIAAGRLLAVVSSRPGQSGRCDGYILEGEELSFYLKKIALRKGAKKA